MGLAAEPAWAEHQNMFSNNYGPSPETIGRYLLSSGGTKVAVITSGNSSFNATAVPRFEAALRSVGVDTVGTIPYSRGGEAPARIVQQIAERGANALVGFTEPSDFADIVGATQNARISMAASVSLSGYDQELLKTSGPALAGVSFPVYFRPFEAGGAAIDSYRNAMTRYAPETVHPEQQFAMFAYIYADMFLRGLQLAGPCPTREGFIKALRGVTSYDSGGLIEPVNLSTNRGQPSSCNAFVRIDPAGTAFQVTHLRVCADGSGS